MLERRCKRMFDIALLPGDGIGPEVVKQAVKVLNAVGDKYGHNFRYNQATIGGAALVAHGRPLPEETLEVVKGSQAVLLGAVGGPQWDELPAENRPERGLLALRKELGVYANLRPVKFYDQLEQFSPLKEEIIKGADLIIVRELTGGIYFGDKGRTSDPELQAWDNLLYHEYEIKRILEIGFKMAMQRNKKLSVIDKANVLESSRLWRETALKMAPDFPEVDLTFMYVDNAAMQLITNPKQFDVIVTENMFGDILSDEASVLCGSLGMLPSASIGGKIGLYEPAHGSAPDIAGLGLANPIATILSTAMLLRYSFQLEEEASKVEWAVNKVLEEDYRTKDIWHNHNKLITTDEMGDLIASKINK